MQAPSCGSTKQAPREASARTDWGEMARTSPVGLSQLALTASPGDFRRGWHGITNDH